MRNLDLLLPEREGFDDAGAGSVLIGLDDRQFGNLRVWHLLALEPLCCFLRVMQFLEESEGQVRFPVPKEVWGTVAPDELDPSTKDPACSDLGIVPLWVAAFPELVQGVHDAVLSCDEVMGADESDPDVVPAFAVVELPETQVER